MSFVKVFICRSRTSVILRGSSTQWNTLFSDVEVLIRISQTSYFLLNYKFGVRAYKHTQSSNGRNPSPPNISSAESFFFYLNSGQFDTFFLSPLSIAYANTSGNMFDGGSQTGADDNLISIRRQGFINIVIKAHSVPFSPNGNPLHLYCFVSFWPSAHIIELRNAVRRIHR